MKMQELFAFHAIAKQTLLRGRYLAMGKILLFLMLLSSVASADALRTVYSPYTGKLDYVNNITSTTFPSTIGLSPNQCVQTNGSNQLTSSGAPCGSGGSGGSSGLEVLVPGVARSSPTATISFSSSTFTGTVVSGSTMVITAIPPGANTQITRNQGGLFYADSSLTFSSTTNNGAFYTTTTSSASAVIIAYGASASTTTDSTGPGYSDVTFANGAAGQLPGAGNPEHMIWLYARQGQTSYARDMAAYQMGVSAEGVIVAPLYRGPLSAFRLNRRPQSYFQVGPGSAAPKPVNSGMILDFNGPKTIVVVDSDTVHQGYFGLVSTYTVVGSTSSTDVHIDMNGIAKIELPNSGGIKANEAITLTAKNPALKASDGTGLFWYPGVQDTWLGYGTNLFGITGTFNTFYGANSGAFTTTGNFNNCIGNSCMGGGILIGENNNGMGYAALNRVSSGFYNTGVGGSSGERITTGANNTAVGAYSLDNNSTADNNTAIGYRSLFNKASALNIGIGYESGNSTATVNQDTSGSKNIWIGSNTGQDQPSATVINNSCAIGDGALVSKSNQAQLGGRPGSNQEWEVRTTSVVVEGLITAKDGTFTNKLTVPSSAGLLPTAGGQLVHDTTTGMYSGYNGTAGSTMTISGVLMVGVPANDILVSTTITTTETPFATQMVFPAGFWTAGKTVRVVLTQEHVATATIPTVSSRLRLQKSGPTNVSLYQSAASAQTATATYNQRSAATFYLSCITTGASGTIRTSIQAAGIAPFGTNPGPSEATFDTTAAQTLQLTLTYGASSNQNFDRLVQFIVEALN